MGCGGSKSAQKETPKTPATAQESEMKKEEVKIEKKDEPVVVLEPAENKTAKKGGAVP